MVPSLQNHVMLQHVMEWYLPCQLAISTGSCSKIMSANGNFPVSCHRIMLQNHVSEWYLPWAMSTGSCSKIMSANGNFPVSWRYPPDHAPKSCQRMVPSLSAGYVNRIMLQNHVSEWYLPCQLAISTGSCSKIMSANGNFPVSWRYPPDHAPKSCQRMLPSLSAGYVNRITLPNHVSEWYLPCQLAICSTGIMLQNHVSEWYLPCQLAISTGSCSKIMSANGNFPVSWRYPPDHAPKSCQRMVPSLSAGYVNRIMLQNHVSEW